MSVLLDALKKAAKEKQAKQEQSVLDAAAEIKTEQKTITTSSNTKSDISDSENKPLDSTLKKAEIETTTVDLDTKDTISKKTSTAASPVKPEAVKSKNNEPHFTLAAVEPVETVFNDPVEALDAFERDQQSLEQASKPSPTKTSNSAQQTQQARYNSGAQNITPPTERAQPNQLETRRQKTTFTNREPSQNKPAADQVNKLFSSTLNTSVKSKSRLYIRKTFYVFMAFSLLVLLLVFYALYMFNNLEKSYQQEVQRLQAPGLVVVEKATEAPKHREEVAPKTQEKIKADSEKLTEVPVEAKPTLIPKKTPQSAEPKAKPAIKPSYQIKQVEQVSDNEMAYEAYLQGDYERAGYFYQSALTKEGRNVSSLLGLAAVHAEIGENLKSIDYYQQVLKLDPNNRYAAEGMASIATRGDQSLLDEYQLKNLIENSPNSAALQVSLGHYHASRNDWFKAQPYYFESVRLEPDNASYRLNLAISLDHLGQFSTALEQYKMSVTLNKTNETIMNSDQTQQRIDVLETFLRGDNG